MIYKKKKKIHNHVNGKEKKDNIVTAHPHSCQQHKESIKIRLKIN